MKLGIRQWTCCGVLIALAAMVAACGSTESTPTERAEAEYRALNTESEQINQKVQAKLKQALAANERTAALLAKQESAALQEDRAAFNALQSDIARSVAREEAIQAGLGTLEAQSGQIERQLATTGDRVEQLKGCDRKCREARDQAIDRQLQCWKEGLGVAVCQERFPVPRSDILAGVVADE